MEIGNQIYKNSQFKNWYYSLTNSEQLEVNEEILEELGKQFRLEW